MQKYYSSLFEYLSRGGFCNCNFTLVFSLPFPSCPSYLQPPPPPPCQLNPLPFTPPFLSIRPILLLFQLPLPFFLSPKTPFYFNPTPTATPAIPTTYSSTQRPLPLSFPFPSQPGMLANKSSKRREGKEGFSDLLVPLPAFNPFSLSGIEFTYVDNRNNFS